jgi:hypothetical protein
MKTMIKTIISIFAFFVLGLFLSCGEMLLGTDPEDNPQNNFQILWDDFDKHYSRFELKGVNWDSLYLVYQPQINVNTTGEQLFDVFSSLISHLKDSHARLETRYGIYHYWPKNYNQYFNLDNVKSNYLINAKSFSIYTYGKLEDSLGYLHINSFFANMENYKFIDTIIREFENCKGVVIDVRNNGGGNSSNSEIVASRFSDTERLYAYSKFRNGPNHNDFTELFSSYLKPDGEKQFTKPIVILTNRYSGSATEDFVLMMKVFPYVTLMGDTTSGSIGGHPITRELPNSWIYRLSTGRYYSSDKVSYEGIGIPPNIPVLITESDSLNGKDTILEKAIELLK